MDRDGLEITVVTEDTEMIEITMMTEDTEKIEIMVVIEETNKTMKLDKIITKKNTIIMMINKNKNHRKRKRYMKKNIVNKIHIVLEILIKHKKEEDRKKNEDYENSLL